MKYQKKIRAEALDDPDSDGKVTYNAKASQTCEIISIPAYLYSRMTSVVECSDNLSEMVCCSVSYLFTILLRMFRFHRHPINSSP